MSESIQKAFNTPPPPTPKITKKGGPLFLEDVHTLFSYKKRAECGHIIHALYVLPFIEHSIMYCIAKEIMVLAKP